MSFQNNSSLNKSRQAVESLFSATVSISEVKATEEYINIYNC